MYIETILTLRFFKQTVDPRLRQSLIFIFCNAIPIHPSLNLRYGFARNLILKKILNVHFFAIVNTVAVVCIEGQCSPACGFIYCLPVNTDPFLPPYHITNDLLHQVL